jgi:hypothetical protein
MKEVEERFGGQQETSITFQLAPGPQYEVRILPCDISRMGQQGACRRQTSPVNGNVRNAWSIEIIGSGQMRVDQDQKLEYTWDIDRPIEPMLVPPAMGLRSLPATDGAAAGMTAATSSTGALEVVSNTTTQARAHAGMPERARALQAWSGLRRKARQLAQGLEVPQPWRLRIHGKPPSYMIQPPCTGFKCTIVLSPLAFIPGQTWAIRLTVHSRKEGWTQRALLVVPTFVMPSGGSVLVLPSQGTALNTQFELRADGWATAQESLPLTYTFGSIHWKLGTQTTIKTGSLDTTIAILGAGNPADNDKVTVTVLVEDNDGASATTRTTAKVSLPEMKSRRVGPDGARRADNYTNIGSLSAMMMTEAQIFAMCNKVEGHIEAELTAAIKDSDVGLAHHLISSLASMLSASKDSCSQYGSIYQAPPECSNVLVRRQGLRFRLMLMLDNANLTQKLTSTSAIGQTSALMAICDTPAEMDSNLLQYALGFMENALKAIYFHPSVDPEEFAKSYAQVLQSIITSRQAQDLPFYASRRLSHASVSVNSARLQDMHAQTQELLRDAALDPQSITQTISSTDPSLTSTRSEDEDWASAQYQLARGDPTSVAGGIGKDAGLLPAHGASLRQSANNKGTELPRHVLSARLISLVCVASPIPPRWPLCMPTCIHIHIYTHTYTFTYTFTYIHIHTHTHSPSPCTRQPICKCMPGSRCDSIRVQGVGLVVWVGFKV